MNISAERIQVELVKMLTSKRPGYLREAYELGITAQFMPEFDEMMGVEQETPHHIYTVGEHTLHSLANIRADKVLRLAMLMHDMGKPAMKNIDEKGIAHFKKHALESEVIAKDILKRLKFDNDTIHKVTRLVHFHDYRMPVEAENVRRAMHKIGEELFPQYIEVRRADVLAQSLFLREEKLEDLDGIEKLYQDILEKKECVSLKDLAVTGNDLIEAGMSPGKEIGEKLEKLLELVIRKPEYNTKEELLKRL